MIYYQKFTFIVVVTLNIFNVFKYIGSSKSESMLFFYSDLIANRIMNDFVTKIDKTSVQNRITKVQQIKVSTNTIPDNLCKSTSEIYPITIASQCQKIDFPLIECHGFCQSKSFVWKNGEEIQDSQCCSMTGVYYDHLKIYCSEKLDFQLIKKNILEEIKNNRLKDFFINSFVKKSWTNHSLIKDSIVFKGFYLVKIVRNVTCACQYL